MFDSAMVRQWLKPVINTIISIIRTVVAAHDGIIGNKAADKLAKAGGCSTSVIGQGILAKSAIKRELKEAMLAEWTLAWKSASEGRQIKVFWPEPDLKKSERLIKLSCPMLGMIARFGLGFGFTQRQSAIIEQSRNPPMGNVSCRRCGEDDETLIHIICGCGSFVSHRLDTIGVHQMPETNPKWDVNNRVKFLQLEDIILMEDC
jgi:hypothetical protein